MESDDIRHKLNSGFSIGGLADVYRSPRNERLEESYVAKYTMAPYVRVLRGCYYLEKTNGWLNGNFWVSLNRAGRLYFLIGFSEGSFLIYNESYSQTKSQETKDLMEKTFNERYTSKGTTYRAVIDFLDEFCSASQYRIISIETALEWFHLSANGKITVKEIDDRATEILKFYA
jgi:hypothetical protein